MTYLVALAFILILGSLAFALFFMLKGGSGKEGSKSGKMAWALAARIGLSVLLFACILLGWKLGYLHPTGIPVSK
jgi:hypothetical protein